MNVGKKEDCNEESVFKSLNGSGGLPHILNYGVVGGGGGGWGGGSILTCSVCVSPNNIYKYFKRSF